PWANAKAALPAKLKTFERLAEAVPGERGQARTIARLIDSYIREYSVPLVRSAREVPAAAATPVATAAGRRRIDEIRSHFVRILAQEQRRADEASATADRDSRRAVAVAVAGLVALAAIVVLFGLYVARSIARPVRQVADEAQRLAAGDTASGLRERGS